MAEQKGLIELIFSEMSTGNETYQQKYDRVGFKVFETRQAAEKYLIKVSGQIEYYEKFLLNPENEVKGHTYYNQLQSRKEITEKLIKAIIELEDIFDDLKELKPAGSLFDALQNKTKEN